MCYRCSLMARRANRYWPTIPILRMRISTPQWRFLLGLDRQWREFAYPSICCRCSDVSGSKGEADVFQLFNVRWCETGGPAVVVVNELDFDFDLGRIAAFVD